VTTQSQQLRVAVIGAGPAGLMAAEVLSQAGIAVTVYERMASPARKFLMAGRGGLNLTHSEPLGTFVQRYGECAEVVVAAVREFPPQRIADWCEGLGIETFVGSSGRVFPRTMKASPLLRAWLKRLGEAGVVIRTRHDWRCVRGDGSLLFETGDGPLEVRANATVLATGGGSWARLGSNGAWVAPLRAAGVAVNDLVASNCGVRVEWTAHFAGRFEGAPLKRIAVTLGAESVRGEAMVTRGGLEGGAVYALSRPIREALARNGVAQLRLDLKPDMTADDLANALGRPRGKASVSSFLRKAGKFCDVETGLMHEAALAVSGQARKLPDYSACELAALAKAIPVQAFGLAPMERAISTAGGVAARELDQSFMLRNLPGVFVAGEMIDWDAPTGGYLLTASFASGRAAGLGAIGWLAGLSHRETEA